MSQLDDSFNMAMLPKCRHREFPKMTLGEKRNLRPADRICESCGRETTGVGGMTYIHGRWLCNDCQDKERSGKL